MRQSVTWHPTILAWALDDTTFSGASSKVEAEVLSISQPFIAGIGSGDQRRALRQGPRISD